MIFFVADAFHYDMLMDMEELADKRVAANKRMWNVLSEWMGRKNLKWTEVARALDVPVSTINSRRSHNRDIEFGLLVSMLEMLGCSLMLTTPAGSDGKEMTLALRGLLRQRPNSGTLLEYMKTGTQEMVELYDGMSPKDREMVHSLAVRLKDGKPVDN